MATVATHSRRRCAALAAALLLLFAQAARAGELYARAIGEPPETPPPAPQTQPPVATPPPETPPPAPETTAQTPAEGMSLGTKVLIGAGIALALAALGGGGGNGNTSSPASTSQGH